MARGARYAKVIAALVGDCAKERVLEVGCGAGHTIDALLSDWPSSHITGLEAAPQLAAEPNARKRIVTGFLEDLPLPAHPYDVVIAVNVIEHAADPCRFLASMKDQLALHGRIVLICPSSACPNLELVFFDHISTFSRATFQILARNIGLEIRQHADPSEGLGDFQHIVLSKATPARRTAQTSDGEIRSEVPSELARSRVHYIASWGQLDNLLLDRTSRARRLALFGAGEVASLLRAYAPKSWQRASMLIVDNAAGGRALGLPVFEYPGVNPEQVDTVIVATHPRSQPTIASRLRGDGFQAVCFNDLITC